ncbi:MAG TPA: DUF3341 domain-containing protein [Thermoanaerobaculia bacterium]|nr:DUF3341 domain-containing protein [Thermoanaerobaculia bacterium]
MTHAPSHPQVDGSARPQPWGLLAEFSSPEALVHAAQGLREAGFARWDAHTPFPLHSVERAMGLPESRIPWFTLVFGLGGAISALGLQAWVSAVAYPLRVGGKPYFSWPAFVPISFEVGVLGAAVGTVLGLLLAVRLPRHHHPLFGSRRFERATDDGFFLSVEATDPRFGLVATSTLLHELGAQQVEVISAGSPEQGREEPSP